MMLTLALSTPYVVGTVELTKYGVDCWQSGATEGLRVSSDYGDNRLFRPRYVTIYYDKSRHNFFIKI